MLLSGVGYPLLSANTALRYLTCGVLTVSQLGLALTTVYLGVSRGSLSWAIRRLELGTTGFIRRSKGREKDDDLLSSRYVPLLGHTQPMVIVGASPVPSRPPLDEVRRAGDENH